MHPLTRILLGAYLAGALFIAAGTCGCSGESDEDGCIADAECEGYACVRPDGAASGRCLTQCLTSEDCGAGFACNVDQICEPGAEGFPCVDDDGCASGHSCGQDGECSADDSPASCRDDSECAGYACDTIEADEGGVCLTSCDTEADCARGVPCTSDGRCGYGERSCFDDSDCDGYACLIDEGFGQGQCLDTCAGSFDCSDGYECDAEGSCQAPDGLCPAGIDCGSYLCNEATGACFDVCESGADCIPEAQCTGGFCEVVSAEPYSYVAVVSEVPAESEAVVDTTAPGPDIDAIGYRDRAGVEVFALLIHSEAGSAPMNDASAAAGATGPPAIVPSTPGDCDFTGGGYWSMGANDGFGVFAFDGLDEIRDGGVITVHEIGTDRCTNAAQRDDAYSVWIGGSSIPSSANELRSAWCAVGRSSVDGGVFSGDVRVLDCQ